MSVNLAIPRRSPLAFPGTPPGIDWTHPALRVPNRGAAFSAVYNNQTFTNLFGKNSSTAANASAVGSGGSPVFGQDAFIGPNAALTVISTQAFAFTAAGGASTNFVVAAICRQRSSMTGYGGIIELSDSATGLYINNNVMEVFDGGDVSSGIATTPGTPYFFAASVGATVTNFVAVNLQTGKIQTSSVAHTSSTPTPSTIRIGGDSGTETFLGGIHAVMISQGTTLSIPELVQWGLDPWSFWYPRHEFPYYLIGAVSVASPLAPGAWFDPELRFAGSWFDHETNLSNWFDPEWNDFSGGVAKGYWILQGINRASTY